MRKLRAVVFVLVSAFLFAVVQVPVALAALSAPTGLKALSVSTTQINLSWSAVSGASKYLVYRATSSGGSYTKIATVTTKTYQSKGLTANKKYYYKVRAANSSGSGAYSAVVSARTRAGAPSGIKVTAPNTSSIKLTWTAVTAATKYVVYRSTTSTGTYTKVGEATTTVYTNTGLSANKVYYYKVSTVNAGGEGSKSAAVSARTRAGAPSGIKATAPSTNSIKLTWTAVTAASKYVVYRSATSSGTYTKVGEATTTAYTNTGLAANKAYYYKLATVNAGGEGGLSAAVWARTRAGAPSGLQATAQGASSIKLTWTAVTAATKYVIYRSAASGGTYAKVGEATTTTYTNTGLSANTTYYYKVSTVNTGGEGGQSAAVWAKTTAAGGLPAPTNFSAEPYNYQSVQLYYDVVQNAVTYRIYYSTTASQNIADYQHFDWPSKDCRVVGLNANTTYYFRVAAIGSNGAAGTPTGFVAAKTSAAPSTPATPRFVLDGIDWAGSLYRMKFDHGYSAYYPSGLEPTFEFYCASTEAGLASDEPDVLATGDVMGSGNYYFYEDVTPGRAMWYGFRACFGPYKSQMQKLHLAALANPTNVKTSPISSAITLSWNSVNAAAQYRIYYCVGAPDTTKSWAEFKASMQGTGNLVYWGSTSATSVSIYGMPIYSSYYYIVVPADASGVEGWYYGYAIGTVFY